MSNNDRVSSGATRGSFGKLDLCFLLMLALGLLLLLWKAPLGYANIDETFYLSVPYRLCQGDALLLHEWNLSQLTGFLLYPLMRIYLALSPSADGIVLAFRYFYLAAQLLTSCYIFIRLRRISPLAALLASGVFLLYTPLNIMALSYNTIGLMLMCALCVTAATTGGSFSDALLTGLLFAGAVLCFPFLLALYLLYSLLVLAAVWSKGLRARLPGAAFTPRFWLGFTAGAVALALLFALFIISRASLADTLNALPHVLNDPEHKSQPLYYTLFKYAEAIYANSWFNELALGWLLTALLMAFDRKRLRHREVYLALALLFAAAHFSYFVLRDRQINYFMFPINILGGFAYFLCAEKDRRPFFLIYLPGLLYSLCMHFSSNLALMSIGTALTVSCLASCYYILRAAKELCADSKVRFKRVLSLCLIAAIIIQAGALLWCRAKYVFWDSEPSALDAAIDAGPERGIRTTAELKDRYDRLLSDTAGLRGSGYVLYYTSDPWLYLADDARMGAYSAWLSLLYPDISAERLRDYWQLCPDRVPDTVYVSRDIPNADALIRALNIEGRPVTELPSGYVF